MKPKDHCQECGRIVCSKKLNKSKKDGRNLCGICYKSENKQINGLKPVSVPGLSNSMQNKKKATGKAKMGKNNSYVMRGEGEYLKKKYGNKYYEQYKRLKSALGETRMKMIQDNSESIDRQKREEDLNKKLIEGLK